MIRTFLKLVESAPKRAAVVHPLASQRVQMSRRLRKQGYEVDEFECAADIRDPKRFDAVFDMAVPSRRAA
ncbi:MAG: hypothetical protein GY913_07580 [Proteobacteria bacterium]|nr:hypothetical protein [Pseudomonadota bacterium]MCP4916771.1 hypothetical protein [Pseudomonadota bacterium]